MLYVTGCPTFDPDDEAAEWAAEYVSFPDARDEYLPLNHIGVGIAGIRRKG